MGEAEVDEVEARTCLSRKAEESEDLLGRKAGPKLRSAWVDAQISSGELDQVAGFGRD